MSSFNNAGEKGQGLSRKGTPVPPAEGASPVAGGVSSFEVDKLKSRIAEVEKILMQ